MRINRVEAAHTDRLYLRPGKIGNLTISNRLIRAATSETMANDDGNISPSLIDFYTSLAKGKAGLLISGHMYINQHGQYLPKQVGIHSDNNLPGLSSLTDAVHKHGGTIFAELSHAGSQCMMPNIQPIAPSVIPNAIFERMPKMMSIDDINLTIDGFGKAAKRAQQSGFDGIHIHSGNGYLLSEFNSPHANRRDDDWGGDHERRDKLLLSVYQRIRQEVGDNFPITARIGITDTIADGLEEVESLDRIKKLEAIGLDGVEVSYGVMSSYLQNIRPYVAVNPKRAFQDALFHRVFSQGSPEAYYRGFARSVKQCTQIPVILVGGIRTTETMNDLVSSGDTDFIAMARPFIREPDLPKQLIDGRTGLVDCVSCNMCLMHEGKDGLRCWRKQWGTMFYHAYCRFWRDRQR